MREGAAGFDGLRVREALGATVAVVSLLVSIVAGPAAAAPGPAVESVAGSETYGDLAGLDLVAPVVGASGTPTGFGYWLVASDGGVFAFGDAEFHGSMGGVDLVSPVVGLAPTVSGAGYWLVASDGGVFAFGDAEFHGSIGGTELDDPVVGIAAHPGGDGYWMTTAGGRVIGFGQAFVHGSVVDLDLVAPILGIVATPTGDGYRLIAGDGGVFAFGDATFLGSVGGEVAEQPVVALVPLPEGAYALVGRDGRTVTYTDSGVIETPAVCRARQVTGAALGPGGRAWLTTEPVAIDRSAPSARSSGVDSDTLDELIDLAQACQQTAVEPVPRSLADPLPGARLSSRFGERRHPIWGRVLLHSGIDLAAPRGTAVRAAADGTVIATIGGLVAYGDVVVVDHGDRVATVYAHLSRIDVRNGDTVTRGETVGAVGTTGFATGPHLHVEIRVNGQPVDPLPMIRR